MATDLRSRTGGVDHETTVFLDHFKDLPDPRQAGKVLYPLQEVLLLTVILVVGQNPPGNGHLKLPHLTITGSAAEQLAGKAGRLFSPPFIPQGGPGVERLEGTSAKHGTDTT